MIEAKKSVFFYEEVPNGMAQAYQDFLRRDGGHPFIEDNRDELFALYRIDFDDRKYGTGWNFRCNMCGQIPLSTELFFPCKGEFFTVEVKCYSGTCKNRWTLQINPCLPDGMRRQ